MRTTDTHIRLGEHRLRVRTFDTNAPGAQPALFVHGLGIASSYFVPLARELARHRPVAIYDLPGHGGSSDPGRILEEREHAALAISLCDTLFDAATQPLLVGHSWGCPIVLEACHLRPERFPHAVLLGPAIDELHESMPAQIGRLLRMGGRQPLRLNLLEAYEYLRTGIRRTLTEFDLGQQYALRESVRRTRTRLLIARGARDPLVSPEWLELLAATAPSAATATIGGAAHVLHWRPFAGEVAAAIEHFLAADSGPSTTSGPHPEVRAARS